MRSGTSFGIKWPAPGQYPSVGWRVHTIVAQSTDRANQADVMAVRSGQTKGEWEHDAGSIAIGRPAARGDLRRRLGRRALRPPAPGAIQRPARRSRRGRVRGAGARGTGRWCWTSAGSSWATRTTPRTPSRPCSSSWRGRPARSAIPTCSAPGSTAWRSGRRASAAGDGTRTPSLAREESADVERPAATPSAEQAAIDREQAEALHVEIDRLPEAFRLPVVLCYFEGLTLDEAARRLRWPAGTLRSRLARAREKLRRGLARRGRRDPRRRDGRDPRLEARPDLGSPRAGRGDDPGCDRLRQRDGRRRPLGDDRRRGAPLDGDRPGGPRRGRRDRPRGRRHRGRMAGILPGDRERPSRLGPARWPSPRSRPSPRPGAPAHADGARPDPRGSHGSRRDLSVASGPQARAPALGVGRAGGTGDPRRRPVPQIPAAPRTAPGPTRMETRNRGRPAWWCSPCSRPARRPIRRSVRKALDRLRALGPDDIRSTYAIGAADHGLRRHLSVRGPVANHRRRRWLGGRSQARGCRHLARLVDLHRLQARAGTATTRTRNTPCSA